MQFGTASGIICYILPAYMYCIQQRPRAGTPASHFR